MTLTKVDTAKLKKFEIYLFATQGLAETTAMGYVGTIKRFLPQIDKNFSQLIAEKLIYDLRKNRIAT